MQWNVETILRALHSVLACSLSLGDSALLASLVPARKASWRAVFNGFVPVNVALDAVKLAIHYPYVRLHSSSDLRKFFLWGRLSDLQLVACENILGGLN